MRDPPGQGVLAYAVAYPWSAAESNTNVSKCGGCTAYGLGPEGHQHNLELGDTLEVTVRGDDGEVALQSGSGDQGINITDKPRTVWRA